MTRGLYAEVLVIGSPKEVVVYCNYPAVSLVCQGLIA